MLDPKKMADALRERAPYTHQRTAEALHVFADILDPKGSREAVAVAARLKTDKEAAKKVEEETSHAH